MLEIIKFIDIDFFSLCEIKPKREEKKILESSLCVVEMRIKRLNLTYKQHRVLPKIVDTFKTPAHNKKLR